MAESWELGAGSWPNHLARVRWELTRAACQRRIALPSIRRRTTSMFIRAKARANVIVVLQPVRTLPFASTLGQQIYLTLSLSRSLWRVLVGAFKSMCHAPFDILTNFWHKNLSLWRHCQYFAVALVVLVAAAPSPVAPHMNDKSNYPSRVCSNAGYPVRLARLKVRVFYPGYRKLIGNTNLIGFYY